MRKTERSGELLADNFIDFRIVKERISIQAVLDHYGIRLRRVNQHALRGACPLPTHSSEKTKESFCVDDAKNIWSCASTSCSAARQGKRGGNILDFVAVKENCSIRDAAEKLHNWFLSAEPAAVSTEKKREPIKTKTGKLVAEKNQEPDLGEVNQSLSFTLKDVNCAHPYVRSRGIKEATAKYFGVGFFPGRGSMNGRVVIPINNERGELIAYAGRSIDATEPKYKIPAGFQKSVVLFNLDRVLAHARDQQAGTDLVIVVEGFFDCMKVFQAGVPNVIALMGSSMSDAQETFLCQFMRVILLLDGDDAGRAGAQAIAHRLIHRTFVKVVDLPDGKQPDQLSSDELKRILGSH
jgi:DNA primase